MKKAWISQIQTFNQQEVGFSTIQSYRLLFPQKKKQSENISEIFFIKKNKPSPTHTLLLPGH